MANKEQLAILKQGVAIWNEWRRQNRTFIPDLFEPDLREANLGGADLREARLDGADLYGANLSKADLSGADLRGANLSRVDLSGANLDWANLAGGYLIGADLRAAVLQGTNLNRVNLSAANVTGSTFFATLLTDVDLSGVNGLETVHHAGPSTIGIDTTYRSKGSIPEVFLRGAGVPDAFIPFIKSLVGSVTAIEYYSCFISFSNKDAEFAKRLYADLQSRHVRCWFAPENLRIGDRFRPRIDEAIRLYDKLLLVLSKDSVKSTWVEKEVETAFEKERKQERTVLFPIRLDDAVMETDEAWAADIRRTRHIGDFREWKNHDEYQKAFERLVRDLKA
jgi:uncharacterized protein YjbI with pentapeptide repeats